MAVNINIPSAIQKDVTASTDFTSGKLLSSDGTKVTELDPTDLPISNDVQTELDGKASVEAGVPIGGTTAQVLAKIDGADYNTEWITPSGGGGITGTKTFPDYTGQTHTEYLLKYQALADKDVYFNFTTFTAPDPTTGVNNDVFMMGWNLNPGGGAETAGKTGIGLSFENNYEPSTGVDIAEHHTFFIDKTGVQHRLQSYTIDKDTPNQWEVYQTVRNWYLKDPVTLETFAIITPNGIRLDEIGTSKAVQILTDHANKNLSFTPVGYATGADVWQNNLDITAWGNMNTAAYQSVKYNGAVQWVMKDKFFVHADNAAALAASRPVNTIYQTPTGELKIVV